MSMQAPHRRFLAQTEPGALSSLCIDQCPPGCAHALSQGVHRGAGPSREVNQAMHGHRVDLQVRRGQDLQRCLRAGPRAD